MVSARRADFVSALSEWRRLRFPAIDLKPGQWSLPGAGIEHSLHALCDKAAQNRTRNLRGLHPMTSSARQAPAEPAGLHALGPVCFQAGRAACMPAHRLMLAYFSNGIFAGSA